MCAALSLSIETASVRSPRSKLKYLSSLSRTRKGPVYATVYQKAACSNHVGVTIVEQRQAFDSSLS